ncbi:MAG: phosphatase PAP2 family protein [Anaerolineales bacterium]|nr:phosphatase PAP2 family protein [Anaerolineales bacterium]
MIYQLLGFGLLLIGCAHLFAGVKTRETQIVRKVQGLFKNKPWLTIFQEIWFFGRTPFAVVSLLLLISLKLKMGTIALTVFLVTVGIENILKNFFKRPRPFIAHLDIEMLQPKSPVDPSFPSGDTLRIWYLALILPVAAGNSGLFLTAFLLLATLVTLGRMILGVHYLTDTITGLGLGMLGAGTTLWLWHFLQLL